MASKLASIKVSRELVDQARKDAAVFNRSLGGQFEHWARLGRAVEQTPGFSLRRVRQALEGDLGIETLDDTEWSCFMELFADSFSSPDAQTREYFHELGELPGAVGYDKGRLVRVTEDGGLEILPDE